MRRILYVGQELAVPVLLVVVWWHVSASSTSLYFPPLATILDTFAQTWLSPRLWEVLAPTLVTFLPGYGLSLVLGVAVGLVLAARREVADFLHPLLEVLRALPGVALVPVFMSVLGVGTQMRVSLVVFASIWPILLNTVDGVRGLDVVVRHTVSAFRVRPWQRLVFVTLPGASPQIMAGSRVALSLALVATIVTEMIAPAAGVGAFARRAQMSFDLNAMWIAIILMGLVGYVLNLTFVFAEKRILRWHLHMATAAQR